MTESNRQVGTVTARPPVGVSSRQRGALGPQPSRRPYLTRLRRAGRITEPSTPSTPLEDQQVTRDGIATATTPLPSWGTLDRLNGSTRLACHYRQQELAPLGPSSEVIRSAC